PPPAPTMVPKAPTAAPSPISSMLTSSRATYRGAGPAVSDRDIGIVPEFDRTPKDGAAAEAVPGSAEAVEQVGEPPFDRAKEPRAGGSHAAVPLVPLLQPPLGPHPPDAGEFAHDAAAKEQRRLGVVGVGAFARFGHRRIGHAEPEAVVRGDAQSFGDLGGVIRPA